MSNEIIASIRKIQMTGTVLGVIAIFLFNPVAYAQDNNIEVDIISDQLTQETRDTLSSIDKVDPNKPKTTRLKRKRGEIISKENNQIKNFKRHKKLVEFSRNGTKVDIGVPKEFNTSNQQTLEDKIVYKSNSENVDLIVENVDGGIRQVILIKDKDQPNRYEFPMNLEEGQKLVSNQDESINVVDKDNKRVLTILKPWAKDANGKDLQTYYKIENDTLVQYINFDNAVFPITADPTWCGNQIEYSRWKYEQVYENKTDWSMNIKLNWCGRATASAGCIILNFSLCAIGSFGGGWDAWDTSYNQAGWHERFKDRWYGSSTYWKMYHQFICHYANPVTWFKEQYNIDPWRYNVGQHWTYWHKCNPPIDWNY